MLKPAARKGDAFYGYCSVHDRNVTGIIVGGASSATAEGNGIACKGDIGVADCGCSTMIITGSSHVLVEGKEAAHATSLVDNSISGIVLSGAGSVLVST